MDGAKQIIPQQSKQQSNTFSAKAHNQSEEVHNLTASMQACNLGSENITSQQQANTGHSGQQTNVKNNTCEECEQQISQVYCNQCNQILCYTCDELLHRKGTRRFHVRKQISSKPQKAQHADNQHAKWGSKHGQTTAPNSGRQQQYQKPAYRKNSEQYPADQSDSSASWSTYNQQVSDEQPISRHKNTQKTQNMFHASYRQDYNNEEFYKQQQQSSYQRQMGQDDYYMNPAENLSLKEKSMSQQSQQTSSYKQTPSKAHQKAFASGKGPVSTNEYQKQDHASKRKVYQVRQHPHDNIGKTYDVKGDSKSGGQLQPKGYQSPVESYASSKSGSFNAATAHHDQQSSQGHQKNVEYSYYKQSNQGRPMHQQQRPTLSQKIQNRQNQPNYYSNAESSVGSGCNSRQSSIGSRSQHQNYQQTHQSYRYEGKGQQIAEYTGATTSRNQQSSLYGQLDPAYFDEEKRLTIPILQPIVIGSFQDQYLQKAFQSIQEQLFELAEQGQLLIQVEDFVKLLGKKLQIQNLQRCQKIIDQAEENSIIHYTKRNFANMKSLSFLSLQVEILSLQCVSWVLKSLRKDEMTPTERAIQSRIKEAFALKVSMPLWDQIMATILQKKRRASDNWSNDEYYSLVNKPAPQQRIYGKYIFFEDNKSKSASQLFFRVKEIEEDPSIGPMKAIYFQNEPEWQGVDQNLENVDQALYEQLKCFLHDYFCSKSQETPVYQNTQTSSVLKNTDHENKITSSGENILTKPNQGQKQGTDNSGPSVAISNDNTSQDMDEVRAIPGGRYGCAQFVKICGPESLRDCSVGKLAQMVQLAVREDVLRYHKTLLVWTTTVDKHKAAAFDTQMEDYKKAAIAAKIRIIKDALIEILAESKSGMSLAQLPQNLKRKLPFTLDLNELGFPKLKDLILSMSDSIKLELKGLNHPFAYLVNNGYEKSRNNSEDYKNVPKKGMFRQQQNYSEDVNISRHLKNAEYFNKEMLQTVLTAIYAILREYPMGIKSYEIPVEISKKLGYEFNHKDYNCQTLLEFLKKYVMPTIEFEILSASGAIHHHSSQTEAYFTIRSKQFYYEAVMAASQYYQQQQQSAASDQSDSHNQQQKQQQIPIQAEQHQTENVPQQQTQQISSPSTEKSSPQINTQKQQAATVQNVNVAANLQQNLQQNQQFQTATNNYVSGTSGFNAAFYIPSSQSMYGGSQSSQSQVSHFRQLTPGSMLENEQQLSKDQQSAIIVPPTNTSQKKPPLAPHQVSSTSLIQNPHAHASMFVKQAPKKQQQLSVMSNVSFQSSQKSSELQFLQEVSNLQLQQDQRMTKQFGSQDYSISISKDDDQHQNTRTKSIADEVLSDQIPATNQNHFTLYKSPDQRLKGATNISQAPPIYSNLSIFSSPQNQNFFNSGTAFFDQQDQQAYQESSPAAMLDYGGGGGANSYNDDHQLQLQHQNLKHIEQLVCDDQEESITTGNISEIKPQITNQSSLFMHHPFTNNNLTGSRRAFQSETCLSEGGQVSAQNAEEEVKSSSGGANEVLSEQPKRQIAQHNQYNLPLMQVRITEETGESYYSKSNNGSNQ